MNTAVKVDDRNDQILGYVSEVDGIRNEMRQLEGHKRDVEHKLIMQLMREKRTECLAINYPAIRRHYR